MPSKRQDSKLTGEAKAAAEKLTKERLWVDQWAKELRGQREWSLRWGALNDPKLYMSETQDTKPAVSRIAVTKWSGFSVINPPGKHPLPATQPELPPGLTPPTFKITGERHSQFSRSSINKPNHKPVAPACQAPFATATPVSQEDILKLQRSHRATIAVYNSTLVGARAGGKVEFARDPQSVYKYPSTTSMEYGWKWRGIKTLEIYGR